MKSLLFSLIISFISFQGCSTEQPKTPEQHEVIANDNDTAVVPKDDENSTLENTEFESEFEEVEETKSDPFSVYNTFMTSFNDGVITYALNPISEVYATLLPQPIRIGVSNAIHNIQFPIRFVNNLLQGKFQNSEDELGRFIINSTIGLAGLMDPAREYKQMLPHNEDFGQTLGFYGVGSGYHIVLPFLGPSNFRDLAGISVDAYLSPLVNVRGLVNYIIPDNFTQSTAIVAGYYINKTSLELGHYESLKKDALELYPFLRDIYEQKRDAEIEE